MYKQIISVFVLFSLVFLGTTEAFNVTTCTTCYNNMKISSFYLPQTINSETFLTCQDLCNTLPDQYTPVCNAACTAVGLDTFEQDMLNQPDLINLCQSANMCPANQNPSGFFPVLIINPFQGPVGSTVNITLQYFISNTINVGQVVLSVNGPSGFLPIIYTNLLVDAINSGNLSYRIRTSTSQFLVGQYTVSGVLCAGSCNSINGDVLYKISSTFTLNSNQMINFN